MTKLLEEQDIDIILNEIESFDVQQQLIAQDALQRHCKSKLVIEVPINEIKKQNSFKYTFIKAKAKLINGTGFTGRIEIDCLVACGFWHKLGELSGDTVDLVTYLPKLLPSKERQIALFTFQNGIQNSWGEFQANGEAILTNLQPEQPLCIGLYNKTRGKVIGLTNDLERLIDEWGNNHTILFTRQLFATLAELLPTINPNALWTHIAHSEGGKIASMVVSPSLHALSKEHMSALNKHLITLTYGSVKPVPNVTLQSINNYSTDDITLYFAKPYLDIEVNKIQKFPYPCEKDKKCYVTIVKSLVPKTKQAPIQGDHSFLGATYQKALKDDLNHLRDKENGYGGIYSGK